MMDIQKLLDAMSETAERERSRYHLTLGKLIAALKAASPDLEVALDEDGGSPTNPHSYRGYYSDLAFERVDKPTTAKQLLADCERVFDTTLDGYKGGDFLMKEATPIWISMYGDSSGRAVIGTRTEGNKIILLTKRVDDF